MADTISLNSSFSLKAWIFIISNNVHCFLDVQAQFIHFQESLNNRSLPVSYSVKKNGVFFEKWKKMASSICNLNDYKRLFP